MMTVRKVSSIQSTLCAVHQSVSGSSGCLGCAVFMSCRAYFLLPTSDIEAAQHALDVAIGKQ